MAKPSQNVGGWREKSQFSFHKSRTMESSFPASSNFREIFRSAPSPAGTIAFRPLDSLEKSSLTETLDIEVFIPEKMPRSLLWIELEIGLEFVLEGSDWDMRTQNPSLDLS